MKVSSVTTIPFCPKVDKQKEKPLSQVKKTTIGRPLFAETSDFPQEVNMQLVDTIKQAIREGKIQFDTDRLSQIIIEHHKK